MIHARQCAKLRSYYEVNSIVTLVFTDKETKAQSVCHLSKVSEQIRGRTGI